MMEEIVIREGTEKDLPEVVALQNRVFHGEQDIPEDSVENFGWKEPRCWCAWSGEKLVGTVAIWREEGRLHCGRFAVDPAFRGKGIGTRLMGTAIEETFRREPEDEIYMEARAVTVRMILGMGGKVAGETVPFFGGTITPMTLAREDYRRTVG